MDISLPYSKNIKSEKFKLVFPDKSSDATFLNLTWNIEGLRRNYNDLNFFISEYKPTLVFLYEPQAFTCDIGLYMNIFNNYKYRSNLPPSPAIFLVVVQIPGFKTYCHIGIYMPTAGQSDQFVELMAALKSTITMLRSHLVKKQHFS